MNMISFAGRSLRSFSALSFSLILAFFAVGGALVPSASAAYTASTGERVGEIRISGTERIEAETVLTYMNVKVGDFMTQERLNDTLKALFATGLFADVSLTQRGSVLEVNLKENPVINEIAFEGNDKLDDDELFSEIALRSRHVFTRTKVQNDVDRLQQLYRRNGRFAAQIEPKVIMLDQNRVNLVFEVNEGDVTTVQSIRFVGNKYFDDDQLRSEISTKEARWYRFLSSADRYDPDRLSYDEELLRRFYLSEGFADFRIVSSVAELSQDREDFFLTITVDEGQRYRVKDVTVTADLTNFDATSLQPAVSVESGEWYDADKVRDSVDQITDLLGDMQYAFVTVRPDVERDRENQTLDIHFNVSEAPRVFVERVDIHGNVRTLDKVIRREMDLVEGDPFNRSKLVDSEHAINKLGYFEKVEVTPRQGSTPDKTIVDVDVSEQSTGELSVGAGFSTQDGPLADVRVRERNFLGRGQDLLAAVTIAGDRTQFDFSFTEPYFLDRDFSAGVDLFHITRDLQDESSFNQRRTGGALRVGYPLSENWRQTLRYRLETNDITDVQENASRFISDQEGERITSAVSQRITFDDRDSLLFPTEGMLGWLDTEFAGLGGDASYVSGKLGASYYHPFWDRNVVLNLMGEGGAIVEIADDGVKINERYFMGSDTMRGFARAGVGPRDTSTSDALGGTYFYRGTAEFTFPVGFPEEMGVKGHAFNDIGSLWNLDDASGSTIEDGHYLRASAGVGLSWRSPMGPIRIDLALPYLKESYDQEEIFQFNFGTRF